MAWGGGGNSICGIPPEGTLFAAAYNFRNGGASLISTFQDTGLFRFFSEFSTVIERKVQQECKVFPFHELFYEDLHHLFIYKATQVVVPEIIEWFIENQALSLSYDWLLPHPLPPLPSVSSTGGTQED